MVVRELPSRSPEERSSPRRVVPRGLDRSEGLLDGYQAGPYDCQGPPVPSVSGCCNIAEVAAESASGDLPDVVRGDDQDNDGVGHDGVCGPFVVDDLDELCSPDFVLSGE